MEQQINSIICNSTEGIERIIETNMRGEIDRRNNNGMDYNQLGQMFKK